MAGAEQLRTKAATIDAAVQLVADRVSAYGRCALDSRSWRDGSCFFHAIAWWLDKIFGKAEALALLKASQVNGAAVRKFLCDWAELNVDLVLDDEGVETVAKLAVCAALDWPDPVDDFAAVPPEARLAAQFAVVLDRMRRGEWADDFWATALAPAALGIKIHITSSAGAKYDRPPQPLPEWVPTYELWLKRDTIRLGHAVVNGAGTHYFVVKRNVKRNLKCAFDQVQEQSGGVGAAGSGRISGWTLFATLPARNEEQYEHQHLREMPPRTVRADLDDRQKQKALSKAKVKWEKQQGDLAATGASPSTAVKRPPKRSRPRGRSPTGKRWDGYEWVDCEKAAARHAARDAQKKAERAEKGLRGPGRPPTAPRDPGAETKGTAANVVVKEKQVAVLSSFMREHEALTTQQPEWNVRVVLEKEEPNDTSAQKVANASTRALRTRSAHTLSAHA